MLLLVPQPLVAFDKMLEYINKMEGVDAILQEYGNLAGKPPQSTPIVRLYKSQKTSYHGMKRSFQDTIRSYQGMIRPSKARNSSLYHDTDYTHAYSTS